MEQDGIPPGRRPRSPGAARRVRGRGRGRPPRVHDHRHRVPGHDPRDQRRGDAERVRRRGRRRRPPVRLRVLGRRLRLPRGQPDRDDRGLARAPGNASVLRAGEGTARAAAGRAGGRPSRPRPVRAASADRAGTTRGRREGQPPGAAGRARAERARLGAPDAGPDPDSGSRPPDAVHPRGRRRPGTAPVRGRRWSAGRVQHRRRRRRHRRRRGARARVHAADRARAASRKPPRAPRRRIPLPSFAPPAAEWVEAASHPAIMDTTKAKRELGWEPRYTGLEALRETIRREPPRA